MSSGGVSQLLVDLGVDDLDEFFDERGLRTVVLILAGVTMVQVDWRVA